MSKANFAVLLLICVCFSSALGTPMVVGGSTAVEPTPRETVTYWFACARGFLQGIEIGMYKKSNYVVNATCLGNATVNETVQIYNLYFNSGADKDIWKILQLIQKVSHQQRVACDFDNVLNDYFIWCDNNDCSLDYMLQNVLKKVIQITTVATNISNILNDA